MLDYLSKQISAVGGIALVACSLSGEGLLSKGAIFTSLFSSNEPEENLDVLFEDLCWLSDCEELVGVSHRRWCEWPFEKC